MRAEEQVSSQEKQEVVDRILSSRHFQRSERLSSFLQHICELERTGRCDEINERNIGSSVFQLPEDFDPTVDGIVRSHASRLRRKLELYYLREGAQETVRIFIPRGGYLPRFVNERKGNDAVASELGSETNIATQEIDEAASESEAISVSPSRTRWRWAFAVAAIIVACAATIFTVASWKRAHAVASVWETMFTGDRQTLIVPGGSSLVMWQQMQRRNVSLQEYITGSFTHEARGSASEQTAADMLVSRRYTSILDLDIVHGISEIAWGMHQSPLLRFARDIRPNDLKDRNIVLIGSAETNPWSHMFEGSMNFVLVKDQNDTTYTVKNKHPMPGEPSSWRSDPTDQLHTAFCKVIFTTGSGSADSNVLILEGTSTAGTECAWEFLSDTKQMAHLRSQSHIKGNRMPHFEVLLRTSNLAGDATANTIVASRILP